MSSNSKLRQMDRARTLQLTPEEMFDQDDQQKLDQMYYNKLKEPSIIKCSSCKATEFFESNDQVVCTNCFQIQSQQIDSTQQWRSNDDKHQQNERGEHLSNQVYALYGDRPLGGSYTAYIKSNKQLAQLQRWQSNLEYKSQQSFNNNDTIYVACSKLDIPGKYIQASQELFKEVQLYNRRKGKKKIQQMAACVYMICQGAEDTRTTDELAAAFSDKFKLKTKDICDGIKTLPPKFQQTSVSTPFEFLNRINNCLKLNSSVIKEAKSLMTLLQENTSLFAESTPQNICSSVLYYICVTQNHKTEQEFVDQINKKCKQISASRMTLDKQKQKIQHYIDSQNNPISKDWTDDGYKVNCLSNKFQHLDINSKTENTSLDPYSS